ncbi:ArgE/DapE family deacylase [Tetragenococcus halophilus]|uniref:ArgE/DapE family deacylase n=1 Tax=Tetragenococcus halophilus TaxID=51669 RepID=UPI000CBE9FB0|nr:ArgE/DapE family deacylase [Tetragenococcus halophilus]MCO7026282.1 ArgE/DapE family deacylase [Tetragenococcus halophilus]MCO8283977.1 ArgE/DapE family deacylase [Tetragenococcus halophilus]GBD66372.1 peptidase M20 family protein [Tetragenococcus halophilus subsp. halophilus]GBD77611.1 peptidase M20 family protein [Tetragenococcus halophilus subsp. halophilus]
MDKEKQIEILANLIAIDSVDDNEAKVANYIASLFEPYNDREDVDIQRVTYAPNRDNLVVTIGTGEKILGFSGHEDVVSQGDLSAWNSDPFKAEIKDNKLFGRGVTDMKGGLAALVITMLDFLAEDAIPGKIRLLATVGEETGEYGAAQLTKAGYADELDGLIIAEPTNEMKEIGISSKGVIDYVVTSIGKGAHSSKPEDGINAIDHLINFANEVKPLMENFDKTDPILGKLTHVQSVFHGGEQINSVPVKAIMKGNIRTIPAYPNQLVFSALNHLIDNLNQKPDYNLSIEYIFPEEAMSGYSNASLVRLIKNVHKNMYPDPIKVVGQTSASDASEFSHAKGNFSIVQIGPGNNSEHQSNENIDIDVFSKSIAFYKRFVEAFFE